MIQIKTERYYIGFYVGALGLIAVFALLTHALIDVIVAEQGEAATVISDTGRQQMRSQRIFALTYSLSNPTDGRTEEFLLAHLKAETAAMRKTHEAMTEGTGLGEMPALMRDAGEKVFFEEPHELDLNVRGFLTTAEEFIDDYGHRPTDGKIGIMFVLSQQELLQGYDQLGKAYERAVLLRVSNLRELLWWFLGSMVVLLVLEAVFVFRPLFKRITKQKRELFDMALTDALTGMPNRRNYFEHAENAFALARRHDKVFSLLAFDIDKFKSVNDTYGHDVGDEVIKHLANLASGGLRESDLFARLGGEEFFALLPETKYQDAWTVAEKIRKVVEDSPCYTATATVEFTCSIGVAELIEDDRTLHEMMNRADAALYVAKNSGRNRVELAVPHGLEAPMDGEVDFEVDLSGLDDFDEEFQ
ncbi:MAG: diguanylate cyclase [Rhodospirillaceae bacterium]